VVTNRRSKNRFWPAFWWSGDGVEGTPHIACEKIKGLVY